MTTKQEIILYIENWIKGEENHYVFKTFVKPKLEYLIQEIKNLDDEK